MSIKTKSLWLILIALPALVFLHRPANAQGGGWTGENGNSIVRAWDDTIIVTTVPIVTGTANITSYTLTGDETVGDAIPAGTITSPNGARTFSVKYDEADSDKDILAIKVVGVNQFGGYAEETFTFENGDGDLIGAVAFKPLPKPVITFVTLENPEAGDIVQVFQYGWGIYSNPQVAGDVISEIFYDESAGTFTERRTDGGWVFADLYNTRFSTYAYATVALEDWIFIKTLTSSTRNTPIGIGNGTTTGPIFINSQVDELVP
jgi:hypothetical protein